MKRRLPIRRIVLVLGGILALAGVEVGLRAALSRGFLPSHRARWIWIDNRDDPDAPAAFAAIRDFSVTRRTERGRLLILADEEYLVKLNGVPVGANHYFDGAPIDAYDVSRILRRGRNRMRVDLRSSRGAGGLLLNLELTDGDTVRRVVSDESWRMFRRPGEDLSKSGELTEGEAPLVWAMPPTGRWGITLETVDRPLVRKLLAKRKPIHPERVRVERHGGGWAPVAPADKSPPALGSYVTFDFGKPVVGYLAIQLPDGDDPPLGLVFTSLETPPRTGRPADAFLLATPGAGVWGDSTPRLLRYVTVMATGPISGARVHPSDPGPSQALMSLPGDRKGVFGLEMGPLRTPLENELRREFQRLASVAGGESP